MKLDELANDVVVEYRIGRAGSEGVVWEPWTKGPLYVAKREQDLQKNRRAAGDSWKAGSIVTLTPRNTATADFHQDDYCGAGVFCSEDYYLEIGGLRD